MARSPLFLRYVMRFLFSLILITSFSSFAYAQVRTLTLQETVAIAQTNSPAATVARLNFAQTQWNYQAYRAQFLPSLFLNGSAPGINRAITEIPQDDGTVVYVEQNRTLSNASLSVGQVLPMTGGEVSVSSGLSQVNNQFGDLETSQWRSTPVLINYTQPIFQFNALKWDRRTEPLRYEVARRAYAETLEGAAVQATSRFFDVYIAEMNVDIAAANVAVNDTIYVLSQGRYEIGKIAENDLLQSELALLNARSDLATARIAYQEALQALKLTLDLAYDAEVEIVPPASVPNLVIDPDEAVARARRNRSAFLDLELQELEARRDVVRARRLNGFTASLTASYGLNQSATTLDDAYIDPLDQQRFGVSFQMPIWRWGQGNAAIASASAVQDRVAQEATLRRKELQQEAYFEALQLQLLQQQVAVAAKADTVAARRFEVAKNRYLIGKIDITDLFNAQREKDTARRSYIQTLRQFWTSYFDLRRLTLYDIVLDQALTRSVE